MNTKTSARSLTFYGSALFAAVLLTAPQPSYAGFQWVSPAPDQTSSAPLSSAPVSSAPVTDSFPSPQIIGGGLSSPTADAPSRWQDTTTRTKPAEKDDIVRGFADNVPLSVALRQVLPQDIGFSVAQDVSLGTLVSWKGGAPWRQVMKDMLLPAGLSIREQGSVVQVVHATESQIAAGGLSSASASPVPKTFGAAPAGGDGKPMTLLPPASNSLPSRPMNDRAPSEPATTGYLPSSMGGSSSLPSSLPTPYVMDKTVDAWSANRGETLQKVFEGWCRRAHVELSWRAEYDFPLQASVSFTGSFEEAVRSMLLGFQDAKPQPVGYLYNSQMAGQTVLVVQTRGNNYNE